MGLDFGHFVGANDLDVTGEMGKKQNPFLAKGRLPIPFPDTAGFVMQNGLDYRL